MAMKPDERGDLETAAMKLEQLQKKYLRHYEPLKALLDAEKSMIKANVPRASFLMMARELGSLLPGDGQQALSYADVPTVRVLFPPLPPAPIFSSTSASSSPPPSPPRSSLAYSLTKDSAQ
jgi:hypothetical protein